MPGSLCSSVRCLSSLCVIVCGFVWRNQVACAPTVVPRSVVRYTGAWDQREGNRARQNVVGTVRVLPVVPRWGTGSVSPFLSVPSGSRQEAAPPASD